MVMVLKPGSFSLATFATKIIFQCEDQSIFKDQVVRKRINLGQQKIQGLVIRNKNFDNITEGEAAELIWLGMNPRT